MKKILIIIFLFFINLNNVCSEEFVGSKWKFFENNDTQVYEFLENNICNVDNLGSYTDDKGNVYKMSPSTIRCEWTLDNNFLTIRKYNGNFKPVIKAVIDGDNLKGSGKRPATFQGWDFYGAQKWTVSGVLISQKKDEFQTSKKYEFLNKDDQYKDTCDKKLKLKFGSEKYNSCVFKIMQMELELTKIIAEREIALAQAETAKAKYNMEKAKQLQTEAALKSEKFKKNVSILVSGLLILSNLNNQPVVQQQNFKKTFICRPTNVSTGVAAVVHCF